ncbi:pyridoxal phosphate-dependent aminotransferase [Pseudooceanicola nanhaiensis]|uniref:pyridoxal phosphate-dependent aminotransferase n=1 Tax=Pseudooceanicola nanhaiensis TaxID=375761 RepID=UPI001CD79617|nr:aminotransferase class I/II-fold pyridoxal phosphate-dependent enzyme [Pseudooceanicola nanhaiensis]MCA0920967.1 aminotransferase class I/II-fold pyridoxal phosphate-dependent enzyme [Pseudooceanicola nanhaiensis]
MRVSSRGTVDPFIVMEIAKEASEMEAAGIDIVHMEIGQPGTPAPEAARRAVAQAMEDGAPMGYTVTPGLPELRARIAQLYGEWYDVDLNPERVLVTPGSSGAFSLAFTSLFDRGARVGIGSPGYPSYRQILKALDLDPVLIETREEDRYQPVPADIAAHRLDGMLVASPANPAGTMLDGPAMQGLMQAAQEAGIGFISDEIYHGLHYENRAVSALEFGDDVYVINSFSKYFSMTGWRIGWMVLPEAHVHRVEKLSQHMFICATHASQVAALAALDATEELEAHRATYARNRALLLEGLPKIGFDRIAPPDGGFYIYADVSGLTDDSLAFAREILHEARVAVTPGLDFDPDRGAHTLRFSYASTTEDMLEGLERLGKFMALKGAVPA